MAAVGGSSTAGALIRSPSFRWAVGGWSFFIAENAILSENRAFLIELLGGDVAAYRGAYGLCSAAAAGSIGYAYWKKVRNAPPFVSRITPASRFASFLLLSVGLGMASQALPKFQLPVAYVGSDPVFVDNDHNNNNNNNNNNANKSDSMTAGVAMGSPSLPKSPSPSYRVRCPFDFAADGDGSGLRGLDRVSRHAGLWSLGLVGLGHALLTPSVPQRIWLSLPVVVAGLGGSHADSRHRRGMGGTLSPERDQQTSNVPFAAMIASQGGWGELLWEESKPWNAALAVMMAATWAVRKGRGGPKPAVLKKFASDAASTK